MSEKIVPKILQYRVAQFLQKRTTLQEYLENALQKVPKIGERKEALNPNEGTYRLINSRTKKKNMLFGNLLVYSQGQHQGLITLDDTAEELEIAQEPPKADDKGRQRELLQSILYFGVYQNHCVVLQSAALRARELEAHLGWLLGECARVMQEDDGITLSNKPTENAVRKMEQSSIKKVSFGTPLQAVHTSTDTQGVDSEEDREVTKVKSLRFFLSGKGADMLSAVLGENWFHGTELEDSLDDGNLNVSLEVSYLRKTTKNAHRLLNTIGAAMRHVDPQDTRIELEGGGVLKGDELQLQRKIKIKTYGGMVDREALYDAMYAWLKQSIAAGVLEP